MLERLRLSVLVKDIEMGGDIDVVIAAEAEATIDAIKADALNVSNKLRATIADLQGQLTLANIDQANVEAERNDLQQCVAQLEGELACQKVETNGANERAQIVYQNYRETMDKFTDLQADHAHVLGLVRALDVPRQYFVSVDDCGGQISMPDGYILYSATSRARTYALKNLIDYARDQAASLPAQPAQGACQHNLNANDCRVLGCKAYDAEGETRA